MEKRYGRFIESEAVMLRVEVGRGELGGREYVMQSTVGLEIKCPRCKAVNQFGSLTTRSACERQTSRSKHHGATSIPSVRLGAGWAANTAWPVPSFR